MTNERNFQPVTTAVLAFLAPVDREGDTGTIFDPTTAAAFDLDHPPAPWVALGEIENRREEPTARPPLFLSSRR